MFPPKAGFPASQHSVLTHRAAIRKQSWLKPQLLQANNEKQEVRQTTWSRTVQNADISFNSLQINFTVTPCINDIKHFIVQCKQRCRVIKTF